MFIQVQETPNPETLKFLPGKPLLESGGVEFRTLEEARSSPLAQRLMDVDGVSRVFFGTDFIAITRESCEWIYVKPLILGVITEHFASGVPLWRTAPQLASEEVFFAEEDAGVVSEIKELIDTRVRPAVAGDGGDIVFRGFRDGVVYLEMKGACSGCPSSTATLKFGVENLLRHFISEVQAVEAM